MILTAERIATHEACPRRRAWTEKYAILRVSMMGALYRALDAGLRTDKDPERAAENEFLALASSPGLDMEGANVYGVAMHHAKLAGIVATALRSGGAPWTPWPDVEMDGFTWKSGCYDAGDGQPRRVALVDRWSDDRRLSELIGWRTVGELVTIQKPLMFTSVEIGSSRDKKRVSPWTRCYQHPRNYTFRFRRIGSDEDFGATWTTLWRENTDIKTAEWLDRMTKDGCMDSVSTGRVPLPPRPERYLDEMKRLAVEMEGGTDVPPMRLSGCHDRVSGPCVFSPVCHGTKKSDPLSFGFRSR